MIAAPRTRPSTVSPRPRRIAGSRGAARWALWPVLLDDRRALRLKWGLLVLLLVIAALFDIPL